MIDGLVLLIMIGAALTIGAGVGSLFTVWWLSQDMPYSDNA